MQVKYNLEDTVETTKELRNDGTFPGYERGEVIIDRGETGTVIDYGYFLQDVLIYSIFFEKGLIVGCLEQELALVERG